MTTTPDEDQPTGSKRKPSPFDQPLPPKPRTPAEMLLRYFEYAHLPDHLQSVSRSCADLAHEMDEHLPDGPEKTTGLRKLLEAKDAFVRAALDMEL
jgi:hypothetical protein